MKTIAELKKQPPVFLNIFNDQLDVFQQFSDYDDRDADTINENFKGVQVLFASYGDENYSGDAFVLMLQDDKLYEVHGSHCSCYGLEGQWTPEETALQSLELRIKQGRLGEEDYSGNRFADELREFLGL